jgi:hypothetical protein
VAARDHTERSGQGQPAAAGGAPRLLQQSWQQVFTLVVADGPNRGGMQCADQGRPARGPDLLDRCIQVLLHHPGLEPLGRHIQQCLPEQFRRRQHAASHWRQRHFFFFFWL